MAEKERELRSVLSHVQNELHVPKDQYNSFGKYAFRNLESINAALKPLCDMYDCGYFLSDEVVLIGERFYTKATATFWANGCEGEISSTAYAREEDEKKGMDEAQISGVASSYARKYAMCGLFAIDSGEEVDAMDNGSKRQKAQNARRDAKTDKTTNTTAKSQTARQEPPRPATQQQMDEILELVGQFAEMKGKTADEVVSALNKSQHMASLGVAPNAVEYDQIQAAAAIRILAAWVEKSR